MGITLCIQKSRWILLATAMLLLCDSIECKDLAFRGVCGKQLSDLMTTICANFGGLKRKRSLHFPLDIKSHDYYDIDPIKSIDEYQPFTGDRMAGIMIPTLLKGKRFNEQKRGIVSECCHKGCTIHEMRGYCDGFQFNEFL